jgi:hypothetical protein
MAEVVFHGQDQNTGRLNIPWVDELGNLHVAADMSFGAEVEIVGEPVLNRRFNVNQTGDNTILTAPAGQLIRIYAAKLSVSADISGEVVLKCASGANLGGIYNPKSGGMYLFFSAGMDFEQTNVADSVIVTLPSGTAASVNLTYRLTTKVAS